MDINGKVLGEGSFAVVYESKNKEYAIKVEDNGYNSLLRNEAKIMKKMSEKDKEGKFVIPIYEYKEEKNFNKLVMKKMKMSLVDIKDIVDRFDNYSIKCIIKSLIRSLNFVHLFGICHGDIKPENVMLSEDYKKIYLIDFGLSKVYKIGGEHIINKKNCNYSGTLRFMSKNVNNGDKMSRRDDLISLGYMCIYLQKGELPWQGIYEVKKNIRYERIGKIKKDVDLDKLCEGCVNGIRDYMGYVYNLGFDENPDYRKLLDFFK